MEIVFTASRFAQQTSLEALPRDRTILLVDLDRCIRCGTCQLACALEHGSEGTPGEVRVLIAGREIFALPGGCRLCRTPCAYYDLMNFWTRCPEEKAPARSREPTCDLCRARMAKGLWPACATRCPMKAIYAGTVEDISLVLRDKRFRQYGEVASHDQR